MLTYTKRIKRQSLLYQDKRPKVALIYAESSITNQDFEKGMQAARTYIDFIEYRESFAKTKAFCQQLKQLDSMSFDVIAIIRGGGAGLEALDEVELLETLVNMNTAWIYGAGHEGEKLFILNIADKAIAIPHALGTYFRDITESVIQKRNKSRAALIEEVKKQFIKQIDESNKKNKELLAQIEKMTKQAQEQSKANQEAQKKQMEENTKNLQKLQEENKKNLEAQQKKNEEALAKFQAQSKAQMEAATKQNTELQKQLQALTNSQKQQFDKMTEQNKAIQSKLEKEQQHNRELEKQLASKSNSLSLILIIAIIALITGFFISKLLS